MKGVGKSTNSSNQYNCEASIFQREDDDCCCGKKWNGTHLEEGPPK